MNEFNFTQWLATVGPLGTMMLFLYNKIERNDQKFTSEMQQQRQQWSGEMQELRQHWSELLKSFCDFKNVTVERFSKFEKEEKR